MTWSAELYVQGLKGSECKKIVNRCRYSRTRVRIPQPKRSSPRSRV
jgi:hypothetical protein